MHSFGVGVGHLCHRSQLWEESCLQVCVDLGEHLGSCCIVLDVVVELSESWAIIAQVANEIPSAGNRVEAELRIDVWPSEWLTEETVELGSCTVKRPGPFRGLHIDFLLRVEVGEEATTLIEEVAKTLPVGIMALCTCHCEVVRQVEILGWVHGEVENVAWLPLTVTAKFNREKQLAIEIWLLECCSDTSGTVEGCIAEKGGRYE